MSAALWTRLLQFRAGPNEHEFDACDEHKPDLERGDVSGLFFGRPTDVVAPVDPDDGRDCYFCREG